MTGGGPCQWHPSHPRAQPALEQPPPPRKTFRLPWRLSKRPAGRARQRRDAGGRGAPGSRAGLQPQLSSRCAPLETCCTAKFCLRTATIRWEGREHPPAAPPPPHCPSSPFFFFCFLPSPPSPLAAASPRLGVTFSKHRRGPPEPGEAPLPNVGLEAQHRHSSIKPG